ncbi:MAG TPA: hypothetical protein VFK52_10485 [Nocardioidaceae bacterium]|nr:hypothetical protein [Nocardioidaceae bacterium]
MAMLALSAGVAQATIHPLVQSVSCAAATAWANAPIGDPPGQTPEGFSGDTVTPGFPFVTVSFPTPLEFTQSDFRALIATGFVDEVVVNADGEVTSLLVDVRNIPKAGSGKGGAHCANA